MFSAATENPVLPSSPAPDFCNHQQAPRAYPPEHEAHALPHRNCHRFYRSPHLAALLSSLYHVPKNQTTLGSHNGQIST